MWANLRTLLATHLRDRGVPRGEVLEMLTMLHDTHPATIRLLRARASAGSYLMGVDTAPATS
jgi:hypothetical protein